jgi:hypothetical protein
MNRASGAPAARAAEKLIGTWPAVLREPSPAPTGPMLFVAPLELRVVFVECGRALHVRHTRDYPECDCARGGK